MSIVERTVPVTVVIPYFNGAQYLPRALRSLALQTVRPREVIVVDDGSQSPLDATSLPGDVTVRVVRHPENKGIPSARNTGIREASSEWIAFLDQDDEWLPWKLERQWKLAEKLGSRTVLWGTVLVMNDRTRSVSVDPPADVAQRIDASPSVALRELVVKGNAIWFITLMVHRDIFRQVGPLAEELTGGSDDYEFVLRLAAEGVRFANGDWRARDKRYSAIHHLTGHNYSNPGRLFEDDVALIEKLAKRYQQVSALKPVFLGRKHRELGGYYYGEGQRRLALLHSVRALQYQPTSAWAWATVLARLLPRWLYSAARRMLRATGHRRRYM